MVGQPGDLVEGMAHVDDGDRQLSRQPVEIGQHFRLARRVERGERLVHQQQLRARGERAGNGDALALAARQRAGASRHQVADAEQGHHLIERDSTLGIRDAPQAVIEVAAHVEVREESRLLDDIAQCAPVRRHEAPRGVVLPHLAAQRHATGGTLEARQRAQHGRLAATRGAEQGRDAGRGHIESDIEREAAARQVQSGLDHRARSAVSRTGRLSA